MKFPQLYATASTGKIKTWRIWTEGPEVITLHGFLDGKLTRHAELVAGKNIGRSNHTTPTQQAELEAKSKWEAKKSQKKYQETIPGDDLTNDQITARVILPMLAQDFRKRSHDIIYPAYVQPKFNGVRCLAHRKDKTHIEFTSRKGKSYNNICQHLVEPLMAIMNVNEIFDGELYVHNWSFQKILKTTKKPRPWGHELEYHVYDSANEWQPFSERVQTISRLMESSCKIKIVETTAINHSDDVKYFHDIYVRDGYEGVIIRNANAVYKFDHRSKDLQKYKEFIDKEFPIEGIDEEKLTDGSGRKAILFICTVTPETEEAPSKAMTVRPKGSIESRVAMLAHAEDFFGKQLTVRYQNLSEDDIPIFPIGIAVRDYE